MCVHLPKVIFDTNTLDNIDSQIDIVYNKWKEARTVR